MATTTRTRSHGVLAMVLLGVVAAAFVVLAAGRITARFGDSDEGINGAVWSYDARSLRDLGIVDSRLGGRRIDGTLYATHPPLIVVETAAAQLVGGDHPWASRAPAWIGAIVTLVLLYRLARRAGYDPMVAASATALAGLTPMLFVYGPMLDTPVTELPFALAVALCWYRDWLDERPVAPVLAGGLALLAALAGWQAAVLVAMCGLALAARALRHRPRALRTALPYLIGGAVGVALSLGWAWWVYGSFHVLGDKFLGRSGSSNSVGIGQMISFQLPWLFELLGLSTIGVVGCAIAFRDRRVRPLAAMALASVAVYAVIFRQAAAGHQYWNYWALFPAAIGWAYLLGRLTKDLRTSSLGANGTVAVLVGLVVVAGTFNLARADKARTYIDRGHRAADLVAHARFPASQRTLPYVGEPYRADAWITYNTDLEPVSLQSSRELQALAAAHPDQLVLLLGDCASSSRAYRFCVDVTVPHGRAADLPVPAQIVPAADLARRLGG